MSTKIWELAQTISENAVFSRRGFLGQAGHGAMGLAAGVSALLAIQSQAYAGGKYCCCYDNGEGYVEDLQRACLPTYNRGTGPKARKVLPNGKCDCKVI